MLRLKTIDAHTAGAALRLVVEGVPAPSGRSMRDKCAWLETRHDDIRRALLLEPRGHADMVGAMLTEPVAAGSHAGLIFMHATGYAPMCGHGVIAAATIALERELLMPGGDGVSMVFDTPAGTIRARARVEASGGSGASGRRVASVRFATVPAFVLQGGVPITANGRRLRADVAFGGACYAIVDGEAAGIPLNGAHAAALRKTGVEIMRAVEGAVALTHPADGQRLGIHGTVFTGPSNQPASDLKTVAVLADGHVDRSPCGTAMAAVMAVIDAMGLLGEDRPFVCEGLVGTCFTGSLAGRTQAGDQPAIIPEIEGKAWVTGEHTFLVSESDPLREGFRL